MASAPSCCSEPEDALIEASQQALRDNPADGDAVRHLVQAYTALGDWPAAAEAARKGLELGADYSDLRIALADALAAQGRFREALGTVLPHVSSLREALGSRVAVWARNAKEAEGKYDWLSIIQRYLADPAVRFDDVAEYTGPMVAVTDIPSRGGKGVVATRDIARGELMCVSRAAGVAPAGEEVVEGVVNDLLHKLHRKRYLRASVLDLSRGPYADKLDPEDEAEIIEAIVLTNAYHSVQLTSLGNPRSWVVGGGLWVLPSRFNHSCTAQVVMSFIGDLAVLHAGCDVKAGEELFTRYTDRLRQPGAVGAALPSPFDRWGFECDCGHCTMVAAWPRLSSAGPDWRTPALARVKGIEIEGAGEVEALLDRLRRDPEGASAADMEASRALVKRVVSDLETLPVWAGHYALPLLTAVAMVHKLKYSFSKGLPAAEAAVAVAGSRSFASEPHHSHTALLQKAFLLILSGRHGEAQAAFETAVNDFQAMWGSKTAEALFTRLYPSADEVVTAFRMDPASLPREKK